MTQDLIQALLDAVRLGDDEGAEEIAHSFAGQEHLLPALRPLLADGDPDRRWWATRTLVVIGGVDAPPLLVARLADTDEGVRCAAAYGLATVGAVEAIPDIAARLADPSGWVRDAASDALAMLGHSSIPALLLAMSDERDGVRVRAAGALRRVAVVGPRPGPDLDPRSPRGQAIGALFRALQDPNYLVHQHAYQALDQMGLLDNLIVM